MNARQQRQAKKAKIIKTTPIPNSKESKKPQLERLSGIMKGIIEYRIETTELVRLMNKYPEIGYRGATASAQPLAAYS